MCTCIIFVDRAGLAVPRFRSHLPLYRAATRMTTKEPASFTVINKSLTSRITGTHGFLIISQVGLGSKQIKHSYAWIQHYRTLYKITFGLYLESCGSSYMYHRPKLKVKVYDASALGQPLFGECTATTELTTLINTQNDAILNSPRWD